MIIIIIICEFAYRLFLIRSIVFATLLYAFESWLVSKHVEQRSRAFETKGYRRLLGIAWKEKKTNEFVKTKIREMCRYEPKGVIEMMKRNASTLVIVFIEEKQQEQ